MNYEMKLCHNCRTITTCLELGCGQGRATPPSPSTAPKTDAHPIASDSIRFVGEVELPPLPEPYTKVIDHNNGAGESTVDAWMELYECLYTAEQYRQGQRDAINHYLRKQAGLEGM